MMIDFGSDMAGYVLLASFVALMVVATWLRYRVFRMSRSLDRRSLV
jgi:hypothetical protein